MTKKYQNKYNETSPVFHITNAINWFCEVCSKNNYGTVKYCKRNLHLTDFIFITITMVRGQDLPLIDENSFCFSFYDLPINSDRHVQ